MTLRDTLRLAFKSFSNRRSRIILTTLGVAVGIGVIMFLISLGYGLQKTILDRITTAEALLTLDVTFPEIDSELGTQPLTLERITEHPAVTRLSPRLTFEGQMSTGTITAEVIVHRVDELYFTLSGQSITHGVVFEEGRDIPQIIIEPIVPELLGLTPQDILGTLLTLTVVGSNQEIQEPQVVTAEVTGVLEDTGASAALYIHSAYLPSTSRDYSLIKVQVDDERNIGAVQEYLISQGFIVSALSDLVDQASQVFRILQIILGIFGVFSLLVAAIGLLNTMTISLLERTNEIGIMRALGASRRDIQLLFLIESALIGFAGGVIGIILGFVSGLIVNGILNVILRSLGGEALFLFATPLWFIIFVLISSAGVGVLAGIYPARRASQLNTLTALRYK
jgi:putative ABC transport system permease protein